MTTAVARVAAHANRAIDLHGCDRSPSLSPAEQAALARICGRSRVALPPEQAALWRLIKPVDYVLAAAGMPGPTRAWGVLLRQMHLRQLTFWAWDEPMWASILCASGRAFKEDVTTNDGVRIRLLVLAYELCGLRRLHRRVGMVRLRHLADLLFGTGAVQPAIDDVKTTLLSWRSSKHTIEWEVTNATLDLLLTCGSPQLEDVREVELKRIGK